MSKKPAQSSNTVRGLAKMFQKDYGDRAATFGGLYVDSERIPTGIFELDLALGGGFPRSRWITIYGKQGSNKTNIALCAIAQHQRKWPEKTCVFVDIEHSFDPEWAKRFGVDVDNLLVIEPALAEKVIDMIEVLILGDDTGLIVVDSLAALLTTQESEADATNNRPGGSSLIIGKFCRKVNFALAEAHKKDSWATIICINQLRSAMAQNKYQSQDKMPGGNAPVFFANMILRCYGKDLIEPKINKAMPYAKQTQFKVEKKKCPILSLNGQFEFTLIPHDGIKIGQSDDFKSVRGYLEYLGHFEKHPKKGWLILGDTYPTVEAFQQKLYSDREYGDEIRAAIIDALKEEGPLDFDDADMKIEEDA